MSLLQSFIDKNRVNVSQISFIEPIASFFNDIRDYMGVQSIFGLFLQLN
jgi:hypothetical protein